MAWHRRGLDKGEEVLADRKPQGDRLGPCTHGAGPVPHSSCSIVTALPGLRPQKRSAGKLSPYLVTLITDRRNGAP